MAYCKCGGCTCGFGSGEKNPNAKLSQVDVDEIRSLVASGEMQVRVAERFGVSRSLVSEIIAGKHWK